MILSTLVTSQLHFEMCAGLYGHPGLLIPGRVNYKKSLSQQYNSGESSRITIQG